MKIISLLSLFGLIATAWSAQICCPNIGCFDDNVPFNNLPLPMCIEEMAPTYRMYTRSNRNTGQLFTHTTVPSIFQPSLRTVFIVHGWNSNANSAWLTTMKNSFLDRENMNAVIVGWGGGAELAYYPQSASNTRTMGAYTAIVINNLISSGGGSNTRMWCTGHSLGAHVCGHNGMRTTMQRTTGMDPAGPNFQQNPDVKVGINPTSGRFVDIIHSDTNTYGTTRTLGHIDFYPNTGKNQPGCVGDICSHSRAYEFMDASIQSDRCAARSKCTSETNLPGSCSSCTCGNLPCAYMGYAADYGCQMSGIFYLTTTGSSPFCTN